MIGWGCSDCGWEISVKELGNKNKKEILKICPECKSSKIFKLKKLVTIWKE